MDWKGLLSSQNHSGNRLAQPRRPGGTRPRSFARVVCRGPGPEDYSPYETDSTDAVISRKGGAQENPGLVYPVRLLICRRFLESHLPTEPR